MVVVEASYQNKKFYYFVIEKGLKPPSIKITVFTSEVKKIVKWSSWGVYHLRNEMQK